MMAHVYTANGSRVALSVDPDYLAVQFHANVSRRVRSAVTEQAPLGPFEHRVEVPGERLNGVDAVAALGHGGETDRAVEWVERAIEAHAVGLIWLDVQPLFRDLREDSRIQSIRGKVFG